MKTMLTRTPLRQTISNFTRAVEVTSLNQYADGQAAQVWDQLINPERAQDMKLFLNKTLRKHKCQTILDVACGTGADSIPLLEEGFEVTSVDLSKEMLLGAQETRWIRRADDGFQNWQIGEANWLSLTSDLEELALEDNFDALICLGNSFPHLLEQEDQRKALEQFYNVLKPGGIMFLEHRNFDHILRTGKVPSRNSYYSSSIIKNVHTYLAYLDNVPIRVSFQYSFNDKKQTEFALSYYPHKVSGMESLLKSVFGDNATYSVFGDFSPFSKGNTCNAYHNGFDGHKENPVFFMHVIQKPYCSS